MLVRLVENQRYLWFSGITLSFELVCLINKYLVLLCIGFNNQLESDDIFLYIYCFCLLQHTSTYLVDIEIIEKESHKIVNLDEVSMRL